MRYAFLADIHSNLAAFTAVLNDIKQRGGVEEMWCLGDVVGYGPEPHECIELLREQHGVCVVGNHDLAAIGKLDTSYFNPDAAAAAHWTGKQLQPEDVEYLTGLPQVIEKRDFTLVHGSPREPVWEYVLSTSIAKDNFAYFKTPYCLVGHSHIPLVFKSNMAGECSVDRLLPGIGLSVGKDRMIINPGGVGQPRDGDPRASYAIYETEGGIIRIYRVEYDIDTTQAKMMKYHLPVHLVARLSHGT
ncbi:MAG: metallophosphoesterase family protein [Chloroflexota bacterium]|nr:metallophosphoesterase family protein [Chloroflexota bacterium]